MTGWPQILAAVGTALGGDADAGGRLLQACWVETSEHDHAQRCVLAHYLADLQTSLDAEVSWDERALAAFAHVADDALAPVGIASAAGLAPSLHLNLGDGYLRQGRWPEARQQLDLGLGALPALDEDGYAAMIRAGLGRLRERLDQAESG